MSGIVFCARCGIDMKEHTIYRIKVRHESGWLMLERNLEELCYDEEAQQAAYLIAKNIKDEGKFNASVEMLKHTPDKKTEGGIILPH